MHSEIDDFVSIAKDYFELIKTDITHSSVEELIVLLMKLYISAAGLPNMDPEMTDVQKGEYLIQVRFEEDMPLIYKLFSNPFKDNRPGYGCLSDDLQDIAADLNRGMEEFHSGRIGNAVFEWKSGLHIHWGEHAVNAIRALYSTLIY